MTKEELSQELEYFFQNEQNIGADLYLLYYEGGTLTTYAPALDETTLRPRLLKDFLGEMKFRLVENESTDYSYDLEHINTPGAHEGSVIYYVPYSSIPKANLIYSTVVNGGAADFTGNNLELINIWGFVIKIGNSTKSTYLFKKNYPVNVVKKTGLYQLFFKNNKFKLLDQDLIKLSKKFDVMLLKDELIILNKKEFEQSFDYIQ